MRTLWVHSRRLVFWNVPILLLLTFAVACGTAAAPTPTATKAAPVATSTAPVAVPTATRVPTPTPTATPVGGVPRRGGTLVQYHGTYPTHFDQSQQSTPEGYTALTKIYLTFLNELGKEKFECDICTKWYLEDGGKTMVFELRGDAKFHNGTPITSTDMKYSLSKLMGDIDGVANQRMGFVKVYVTSMETPDARTFKIHLNHPAPILPAALYDDFAVIFPDGTKRADLSAAPIGPGNKYTSGPFYVKEAVQDDHLLFERNANYFKPGLPYLDNIRFQMFTSATAGATALLVGKIDMFLGLDSPPPQFWPQLNKLEKEGKLASVSQPQWCSVGNIWLNRSDPLIKSKNVRQAINLSQDRQEFGNVRYGGDYTVTDLYPADTTWGRPEKDIWNVMPGYGTGANKAAERAKAKQLLAEAGFPAGIPDLELLTGYTADNPSAEIFQRGLRSVGINAHIQFATDAVQRWAQLKYTILDRRLCLATADPDEVMSNYFIKTGPRNLMAYENPEIERLFPLLSAETDPAKRQQINRQMVDILQEDVAVVTLTDGNQSYWFTSRLHGMNPGLTGYGIGTNRGEAWWLDK